MEIIVAIIAGAASVVGVILTNHAGNTRIMQAIENRLTSMEANAVNLAERVRDQARVMEDVPKLEVAVEKLEQRVEKIEERVHKLETRV